MNGGKELDVLTSEKIGINTQTFGGFMRCFTHIAKELNGARGWQFEVFPGEEKIKRKIHLRCNHKWFLTTFDDEGHPIRTPMPDGEYTLEFPPKSVNLCAVIIDPDPGNPGGVE